MRLKGEIHKNGKFWLIEIPCLGEMTQGQTKKEAFMMIKECLENQIENYLHKKVEIKIYPLNRECFEIEASDSNILFAFLLRMSRINNKKTIQSIKNTMGFKSNNSYQAYEYAEREPSLSKMEDLLKAINPKAKIIVEV